MGKRGIKPMPTNLRVLHGDRKDRINTDEPKPREGLPVCPAGVTDDVRAIWDYTVAELAAMRLVTPADRDALVVYCEAVAQHRAASMALAQDGMLALLPNGAIGRHPAVQIQRDAAAVVRQYAAEFGLTPSSRSTIKTGGATPDADAARLLS